MQALAKDIYTRTKNDTRYDRLIELRNTLETAIGEFESMRDLAALSRQYRETLKEIDELEGAEPTNDGIAEILTARKADGITATVRKDSSEL